jgi:hypothetical protein
VKAGGGEFTVWVDGQKVAAKTPFGFPEDSECLAGVEKAVGASASS